MTRVSNIAKPKEAKKPKEEPKVEEAEAKKDEFERPDSEGSKSE